MAARAADPGPRPNARLARVQATRAAVIASATELFVTRGYVTTTVGDIASAAGVAVQTLYLRFGGKPALLKECFDVAVSGDVEPIAVAERPWVDELRATADLHSALRLLVSHARAILERAVPLFRRIEEAAADPEVADILRELKRQKLEMVGIFGDILRTKAAFNQRVRPQDAADLLYALSSEELFGVLCVERGWPAEKWEGFVYGSLRHHFT